VDPPSPVADVSSSDVMPSNSPQAATNGSDRNSDRGETGDARQGELNHEDLISAARARRAD
jgi:hypothetical protein